jgi:hypothetical protein
VVNSTYTHFRIADPQGLAAELKPHTVAELAPIALEDGSTEEYLLTLHAFQLEGDTCGTRAEWLAYTNSADTVIGDCGCCICLRALPRCGYLAATWDTA